MISHSIWIVPTRFRKAFSGRMWAGVGRPKPHTAPQSWTSKLWKQIEFQPEGIRNVKNSQVKWRHFKSLRKVFEICFRSEQFVDLLTRWLSDDFWNQSLKPRLVPMHGPWHRPSPGSSLSVVSTCPECLFQCWGLLGPCPEWQLWNCLKLLITTSTTWPENARCCLFSYSVTTHCSAIRSWGPRRSRQRGISCRFLQGRDQCRLGHRLEFREPGEFSVFQPFSPKFSVFQPSEKRKNKVPGDSVLWKHLQLPLQVHLLALLKNDIRSPSTPLTFALPTAAAAPASSAVRAACPSPIVPRPSIGTPPAADPSVTSLALPAKSPRLNMKDECVYIYIYLFIYKD